jgi:plastocyanin domain-containing protein
MKMLWLALFIPFLVQPKRASSTGEPAKVREDAVRPEEVYKYGVQEFALIASDTGYFPSRIIVRKNIPVKLYLTSSSARALCFVMDDFSIRKGIAPQALEEIRFLPTKAGQYKFYCPVQEIQGSLVVRD